MSKVLWILWQSLKVTPAIMLATFLVSPNAVRAAQNEGQLATETQASVGVQPQKDVESSQTKSLQKAEPKQVALSATPVASAPANAPLSAKNSAADLQIPAKAPEQLAVNSSLQPAVEPEAATAVEMSKSVSDKGTLQANPKVAKEEVALPAMPEVAPKVAQAATQADGSTIQQINRYSNEGRNSESLDQVTNVSQFSDVRPGDWAYEALRELVERYGCIAGYPDSTYRGNRALSRYEFAAGLRACLNQIEKLIAASTSEFASKEDLEKLRRLVQEFQAELATLGTRVDKLEGRVSFLENHQFSTTTKLVGEAIFAVTDPIRNRNSNDKNTVFGDRVRLELQTSFTGKDILHTRLAAGNLRAFQTGQSRLARNQGTSFEGNQTFNLAPDASNRVKLDWLAYEFPYQASKVYVAAVGGLHADYAPVLNPYFYDGDGGNGSLSTFAQQSPIYRIGGGAGAGIRFGVGRIGILGPTSVSFGYLAGNANDPRQSRGLLNGDYGALGQVNLNVLDRLAIGLTYAHGYHTSGSGIYNVGSIGQPIIGSQLANNPASLVGGPAIGAGSTDTRLGRTITNSYGVEAALRLSDKFSLSGFGMRTNARVLGRGDANIWSYGGGIALPDFGKKGSVLGLFAGIEPTLRGFSLAGASHSSFRRTNSYHLEGFYKYQMTDNISITPGVIWLTSPNQDARNPNAIIGTLRTTFTF